MTLAALARILRTYQPEIRARFLAAASRRLATVSEVELASLIARVDTTAINDLVGSDSLKGELDPVADVIGSGYNAGMVAGVKATSALNATLDYLTLTHPIVLATARYAGARIVAISESTLGAVRDIIHSSIRDGLAPRVAARSIRRVVGLDPRSIRALERFQTGLVGDGVSSAEVARQAARYGQTLLQRRALAISRTETIQAAASGQRTLWRQAAERGHIDDDINRVWITGPNPCDECEAMDGLTAPVDGTYDSPDYGDVDGPTLHPNCECCEGLETEQAVRVAA